LSSVLHL